MYAVDFTPFEKHAWFSLRPAEQATHDNQLCIVKTGNAFAHLRCSTQSIMKKSAIFSPCSYTSPWSISDRSCETKKVNLYETFDLRWHAFYLRNMDDRFHHPFTCVVAGTMSCGKTEFVAKCIQHVKQLMIRTPQRIIGCYGEQQRRPVPTCHWLQNGVSIIKYATSATISLLEIHHRR